MLNFVSDLAHVGEVSSIASYNILADDNNPLEDFLWKFLFCLEMSQL